ncbi:MAG TPA: 6-carboxytetrahydropterin synthase [Acidobacteriota bacterium]|nr:6-carboxytetrahydropterin synthase [Acidobacteriota bacterium]
MYSIVKKLKFCYGHRLLDYSGKCAHPHGHNATVEIELSAKTLDPRGMVRDFTDVAEALNEFIEAELDHRMLLREDDPLVGALREIGEEPFTMKGNPTAENLARLIFEEARRRSLPVISVRFWETDSAFAEYRV